MSKIRNIALLSCILFVLVLVAASPTPTDAKRIEELEPTTLADGDEWLSSWKYRQKHLISGQLGVSTNYQMKFHVEYNVAGSSGEVVDCNSRCQTDFGDIRFTDGDGNTLLDYWMEEKTNGDDAGTADRGDLEEAFIEG